MILKIQLKINLKDVRVRELFFRFHSGEFGFHSLFLNSSNFNNCVNFIKDFRHPINLDYNSVGIGCQHLWRLLHVFVRLLLGNGGHWCLCLHSFCTIIGSFCCSAFSCILSILYDNWLAWVACHAFHIVDFHGWLSCLSWFEYGYFQKR